MVSINQALKSAEFLRQRLYNPTLQEHATVVHHCLIEVKDLLGVMYKNYQEKEGNIWKEK